MVKGFLGRMACPLAGLVAGLIFSDCASSPSQVAVKSPIADPTDARRLWSSRLAGLITDLSVTRNGQGVLVATVPDAERESGQTGFHSTLLNREGKVLWDHLQNARVKSQSIAADASLAVFSTFNEKVSALDGSGKPAWETDAGCRPIVLTSRRVILCYHDDDATPGLAFEVLDWTGKRGVSRTVSGDVLALKVSQDERSIAVGATRGQVFGFDSDFQPVLKKKLPGEVVDLSVSSGTSPRIVVLSSRPAQGQRLTVLDWTGAVIAEARPAQQLEQVEMAPNGESFFAYGNGPRGQALMFYESPVISTPSGQEPVPLQPKWTQRNPRHADFSSPLLTGERRVIVGIESLSGGFRETRIQSFDFEGKPLWTVPIGTEEGAYLFSHSLDDGGSFLVVGSDDSALTAFISKGGPPAPVPTGRSLE